MLFINSGFLFVCLFVGHGPYLVIEKAPTCIWQVGEEEDVGLLKPSI